jgi:hypothetical protein
MITNLGKLLVLLNAFVAILVLSWAVSANLNRQDPEQAVDEQGVKLTDRLAQMNRTLSAAQATFGPAYLAVADGEVKLADYKAKIAARLAEAEGGKFFDMAPQNAQDPVDRNAVVPIRRLLWGPLPANRAIKGADGKDLRGVKTIMDDLRDEGGKIETFTKSIGDSVKATDALNNEVLGLIDRTSRLKRILAAHEGEIAALADERVNWDDRLATLTKRNRQLQARLTELNTGSKVGSAGGSAPAFRNPNR